MRVAHLLRKYNPAEWGGTETAVKRLLDGLHFHGVESVVYVPRLEIPPARDPLADAGHTVKNFRAFVPVLGISEEQKQQLISVGGNLMSFDLFSALSSEKNLSVMHTHAGNRLGGIALTVAKRRKIPLVCTIHGGVLDLPESARRFLQKPLEGGFEWGKIFGLFLRSRKLLEEADAILTCNKKEAELQKLKFPNKRIIVQPHGVPAADYRKECRAEALEAFPQIRGKQLLLSVGRIDPVKNQGWLVEQAPQIFQKFPNAILVLAGSCTDAGYGKKLEKTIQEMGLEKRVLLTGGLPPGDPRLLGLFQQAEVVFLPSLYETFGLVILEAWAAGTTVISSRTSGAKEMIVEGENGWLFDVENPASFHQALEEAVSNPHLRNKFVAAGSTLVNREYDTSVLGGRVKNLYAELIEEKKRK